MRGRKWSASEWAGDKCRSARSNAIDREAELEPFNHTATASDRALNEGI